LAILAVNRQIHDEASGIFYHDNSFEFYYPTQLHAFIVSLSAQRQASLRSLTVHYFNISCGGIDIVGLTFATLKTLSGLKCLHVMLQSRGYGRNWWNDKGDVYTSSANPAELPGIKVLFELRGLTDIRVRDPYIEKELEEAKKDSKYPNFPAGTYFHCYVEIEPILQHFNAALRDAQKGRINKKLLEDRTWPWKKPFPTIDEEE
jgi:hypothetical protein